LPISAIGRRNHILETSMPDNLNLPSRKRRVLAAAGVAALLGTTALSVPYFAEVRAAPPLAAQPQPGTGSAQQGFADLVEQVMPAVMSVKVKVGAEPTRMGEDDDEDEGPRFRSPFPEVPESGPFRRFFDQFPGFRGGPQFRGPHAPRSMSQGSGFVISADGYVVTNYHVVDNAAEVTLTANDGKEYKAKVVGNDQKSDLALLKIDAKEPLAFVRFAERDPRVGDYVLAVGNPFGLGGTVTSGIVSARGRNINSGPYDDFLQIDAPINRGSSGGPSFNLNGEVVGVNSAIISPSGGNVGIGFAIPASTALKVVGDLLDKGSVTRGWLGVQIQPVTGEIAESLGIKEAKGALVADVTTNSPAARSGVKTGDMIISLNGNPIQDPRDLARKVAALSPGQPAEVTVLRGGKQIAATVTVGELPGQKQGGTKENPAPAKTSLAALGLSLAPSGGEGVAVVGVDPDGPAAGKGLKPGDEILEVHGAPVNSPGSVRQAIDKAAEDGRTTVLMLVRSGETRRFIAVPIKRG